MLPSKGRTFKTLRLQKFNKIFFLSLFLFPLGLETIFKYITTFWMLFSISSCFEDLPSMKAYLWKRKLSRGDIRIEWLLVFSCNWISKHVHCRHVLMRHRWHRKQSRLNERINCFLIENYCSGICGTAKFLFEEEKYKEQNLFCFRAALSIMKTVDILLLGRQNTANCLENM